MLVKIHFLSNLINYIINYKINCIKIHITNEKTFNKTDSNHTSQQPVGPSTKVENYAVNSKLHMKTKQKTIHMPKRIILTFTFFFLIFCRFSK